MRWGRGGPWWRQLTWWWSGTNFMQTKKWGNIWVLFPSNNKSVTTQTHNLNQCIQQMLKDLYILYCNEMNHYTTPAFSSCLYLHYLYIYISLFCPACLYPLLLFYFLVGLIKNFDLVTNGEQTWSISILDFGIFQYLCENWLQEIVLFPPKYTRFILSVESQLIGFNNLAWHVYFTPATKLDNQISKLDSINFWF